MARPPRSRSPDALRTRVDLQNLTSMPEWQVFLDFMTDLVVDQHVDLQAPNACALSLNEGRRTLLREIRMLRQRVNDDGRNGTGD